jgi:hypothetical protein
VGACRHRGQCGTLPAVMPFIILLSLPAVTAFSKRPSRVPNGGRQPQNP